jgi:transposase
MRGEDVRQDTLFSYVKLENRIPEQHPLRSIREMVDVALQRMDRQFEKLYADVGRPSIAPERLLRGLLLQVLYTVRSERLLMEQLDYNLLFRWFVGLSADEPVWDHSTFSKNRDRLLEADIARQLFAAVIEQARSAQLLSDEHFSVDGTLIDAWASHKSLRRRDGSDDPPGPGRNAERDFHGERRSNETHLSSSDPQSLLYRKSNSQPAKLSYLGHALMENRNSLLVDIEVTAAHGRAEREAALEMLERLPGERTRTAAADKLYDTHGFVEAARELGVTPHVAQNHARRGGSAIDERTTRHEGYAVSQRVRKMVEEAFGWAKDIGLLRRPKYRGLKRIEFAALLTFTGYNLVRMRNLLEAPS